MVRAGVRNRDWSPGLSADADSHTNCNANADSHSSSDSHPDCFAGRSTHRDAYGNVNAANPYAYVDGCIDSYIDSYAHTNLGGIRLLCARPDCQSHSGRGGVALGRAGWRTAL